MNIDEVALEAAIEAFNGQIDRTVEAVVVEDGVRAAIEAYEVAKNEAQDPRECYVPWQCVDCGHRAHGPDNSPYCTCGSKKFARAWLT